MKALSRFEILQNMLESLPQTSAHHTRRNLAACLEEFQAIKQDLLTSGYLAQHGAGLLGNPSVRSASSQRSGAMMAMIYKHLGKHINCIKAWSANELPILLCNAALSGGESSSLEDQNDLLRFVYRQIPLEQAIQERLAIVGQGTCHLPFWFKADDLLTATSPIADVAILPANGVRLLLTASGEVYRCGAIHAAPTRLTNLSTFGGRFLRGGDIIALYLPETTELVFFGATGEPEAVKQLPVDPRWSIQGGCLTSRGPVLLKNDAETINTRLLLVAKSGLKDITPQRLSSPCAVMTHGNGLLLADAHHPTIFEIDLTSGKIHSLAAAWPHGRALALGSDGEFLYLFSHEHLVCLRRDNPEPLFAFDLLQLSGGNGTGKAFDLAANTSEGASMAIVMNAPGPLYTLCKRVCN